MDMIERVARAIYAEYEARPEYAQGQMNGILADELARAAIKAMRETSAEVAEAGNVIVRRSLFNSTSVWEAMIDEALSRPTPDKE